MAQLDRYYDPVNGRWINRDPIGESGESNLYEMIGNNSANNADLMGLATVFPGIDPDVLPTTAPSKREESNTPQEAIKKCSEQAKNIAEGQCRLQKKFYDEDLAKRKKENRIPRSPLPTGNTEIEWGGRVCKSSKTGKYYCAKPSSGEGAGNPNVRPFNTYACDSGDQYAGFYHSHPNGSGLSREDKDNSKNGFTVGKEQNKTSGMPVGAAYRDKNGNVQVDITPGFPPFTPGAAGINGGGTARECS